MSQYFNTLHREHIRGEILWNVLKVWVVLQKNLSPIIYVTRCGVLRQEHSLTQIEIKITV